MDLYSLDPATNQIDQLVEGWDSLVWSERFRGNGDFELVTTNIKDVTNLIWRGLPVCISESREIMIAERFEIGTNEDGVSELKISGRTFETIMERRPTVVAGPVAQGVTAALTYSAVTSASAAASLLNRCLNGVVTASTYRFVNYSVSTSIFRTLDSNDFVIDRGQGYPALIKILESDNLGIRNIRPAATSNAFSSVIYTGEDKTASVVFDVRAGHFTTVSYLLSNEGYISNYFGQNETYSQPGYNQSSSNDSTPYGYSLMSFDFNDGQHGTLESLRASVTAEGAKYKYTSLVGGAISPDLPYIYGTDYKLGDMVTVVGEYGDLSNKYTLDVLSKPAQVLEYIRTQDSEGESAYPTLG